MKKGDKKIHAQKKLDEVREVIIREHQIKLATLLFTNELINNLSNAFKCNSILVHHRKLDNNRAIQCTSNKVIDVFH